jgi:hypothetical protein
MELPCSCAELAVTEECASYDRQLARKSEALTICTEHFQVLKEEQQIQQTSIRSEGI